MKVGSLRTGIIKGIIGVLLSAFVVTGVGAASNFTVKADTISENATTLDRKDPYAIIDNEDRNNAYIILIEHMKSLRTLYDLSDSTDKSLDDIFYQANVYIAYTDMTVKALQEYVNSIKGEMDRAIGNAAVVTKTSDFLFLCNETPAEKAVYGQPIAITLSLINLGKDEVTDVVVTPKVSTKSTEWPFEIDNASDVKMIKMLPKAESVEQAYAVRQNVNYVFTVSDKAKTGTYTLPFHVQYYRNGNIETVDLNTYVEVKGKPGNGDLEKNEDDKKTSTPRIIVTGFSTVPEKVNAGDTFLLKVSVQNTSNETSVSNIQFDFKAAVESKDANISYEAFLPTSGSATIYVPSLGIGQSTDLELEMTARGDLMQKPYVVTINAKYEDKDNNPFEATTNVSVPVTQPARVDTGDAEVMPEAVSVGETSNITFGIYNMGKNTLYNVKVNFESCDAVAGGSAFIGKIESGATGNVDVMVTGSAANEGTINATISYEDESGNVTSFEKSLNLTVMEMPEEDPGAYEEMYDEMPEETGSFPVWIIIAIVVAIVIVVIIVIIIISKKKRKKRLEIIDDDDEETLL